jgi:hypothetical protein
MTGMQFIEIALIIPLMIIGCRMLSGTLSGRWIYAVFTLVGVILLMIVLTIYYAPATGVLS